ncbi:MAG: crossover junction endodeoxyribonuclease RuvC [Clostridium sp.]|nr:crossover junction endodeoxyribonuclease RuvC [Clostridium sp.]
MSSPTADIPPQTPRTIIGIDPGTNVMGYAILAINGQKTRLEAMGVLKLNRFESHYERLSRIHERVSSLVRQYAPQEMAIEAPFFGKNVQSMLKLGRAQGVAIAAALSLGVGITEYEPRKIKMSITGNGGASKEQVAAMLVRLLNIPKETMDPHLDATDALAAAMCHFYESGRPKIDVGPKSWKEFIARNPDRVK